MLADARDFGFPNDPLVLYLFNPLRSAHYPKFSRGWRSRWRESRARCGSCIAIPCWKLPSAHRPFWKKRAEHRNIRCTGRRGALTHPRFGHKFKLDQRITVIEIDLQQVEHRESKRSGDFGSNIATDVIKIERHHILVFLPQGTEFEHHPTSSLKLLH